MAYGKAIRLHQAVTARYKKRLALIYGFYRLPSSAGMGRKMEELLWVSKLDEPREKVEAKLARYRETLANGPVDLIDIDRGLHGLTHEHKNRMD